MPETVICQYRVRAGAEDEFTGLLARHVPTLRDLELVTDAPARHLVGRERGLDGPLFVEIFEWVDAEAAGRAHLHPEVSQIWERMEPLCEDRGGRPAMDFPHFQPLELG
jgi:hypothetical protein